ncbi:MAG: hypothetical protein CVV56_07450 [Tenericutes bacterium HGW-Tenericutes-1]|jgi:acetyl esterase/lipase|nr:MAG: hypothetical protein CVV56_07450 [Tenericutes bacterium HGW-Tenericutes-1]
MSNQNKEITMTKYPYTKELKGPKVGTGNLKLTNPFLRLFFWIDYIKGTNSKPILDTKRSRISVKGYQEAILDCHVIESNHLDLNAPTIIYLHGGGFFADISPVIINKACFYANELSCKVFIPRYRTTYKHKYPIPVEDCYDATKDIIARYEELGVNKNKVVIYGDSAGGCLAAAVSIMARDRKEFKIAYQMLIYPVTDYLQKGTSLIKYKDTTWSTIGNTQMWKLYLGNTIPEPIDYASPLYAKSLENLPPAYIEPQEIDCLFDEGIAYAKRLEASNVPTILNVIQGSYHAFEKEYPSEFVIRQLKNRCQIITNFFSQNNKDSL